jgi:glycosyltransferase involved in cell wall biosynthesis
MKRVLLVDINSWVGHHRPYFLLYTKLLLQLNYQVDVLCLGEDDVRSCFPEEIAAKTIRIIKPRLFISQKIFLKFIQILESFKLNFIRSSSTVCGLWWFVRNASIETNTKNDSFVFILDLQGYLADIPKYLQRYLLPQAWAGLYIWTPPQDVFQKQLQSSLPIYHSSCHSLCLLNEHLVKELSHNLKPLSVHHFPDVSYLQCDPEYPPLVVEVLKLAGHRKIVFLASLTKKHGLIHFLRLADAMSDRSILFVAMGLLKLDEYNVDELDYINTQMSKPPENLLIVQNIYPPEETLNTLYKIADVAFICYEHFQHSSNKLTKAIGLGTPVLVADNTLLAERVNKYQLGYAVDPTDLAAMTNSIDLLLSKFQFDEDLRTAFSYYHSEQALIEKLTEVIR